MNFLTSPFLRQLSTSKKIAACALFIALSTVTNMFLEIKIFDVQYSLTIFFSTITGIFLGPCLGFLACFIGDLIGFFVNSWGQLYMFWIGISTGMFAFLGGLIFNFKTQKTYLIFIKVLIFSLLSFLICTVLINSTGFYIYNRVMGFSDAFLSYVESKTGSRESSYFLYLGYRLIFLLQILNSLVNYVLLFAFVPILSKMLEKYKFLTSN